jgi:hypothetical protein
LKKEDVEGAPRAAPLLMYEIRWRTRERYPCRSWPTVRRASKLIQYLHQFFGEFDSQEKRPEKEAKTTKQGTA